MYNAIKQVYQQITAGSLTVNFWYCYSQYEDKKKDNTNGYELKMLQLSTVWC